MHGSPEYCTSVVEQRATTGLPACGPDCMQQQFSNVLRRSCIAFGFMHK